MNERRQLLLVLNDVPIDRSSVDRSTNDSLFDRNSGQPLMGRSLSIDFSLPTIGGFVAALHARGVVHGELTLPFVSRRGLRLSPHTSFVSPLSREVYYYHLTERNEDFDIFCLGILALLQHYGLKYRRYETEGFPSHFYNAEGEFIHQDGKELPSYWRQCLHRDPEKRVSFWKEKAPVEHLLLYPLPVLPLNGLFGNEFLLTFTSYLTFDLARKYPRDIVTRINEDEFRRRIPYLVDNLLRPLSTQEENEITLPILHHETLPLYHMLREDELFHEGLRLLATKVSLANVSDSYLLEFFITFTRHRNL